MNDEIKANIAIDRAARAESILGNEMLIEAFATVDSELIDLWRRSKDADARDRVWQATQILEKVREALKSAILNGKVAKAILADIEGKRSRKAA